MQTNSLTLIAVAECSQRGFSSANVRLSLEHVPERMLTPAQNVVHHTAKGEDIDRLGHSRPRITRKNLSYNEMI